MFDPEFNEIAQNQIDLYSQELRDKIELAIANIDEPINNGVYKAANLWNYLKKIYHQSK
jgi:glutathionyl-hydroquinone reductase